MDILEIYQQILYVVSVLIIPLTFYATVFAWMKVLYYVRSGDHYPKLLLVLAVICTIAFISVTYLGLLVIATIFLGFKYGAELRPITSTAFLSLEMIPLIIMGYLIWRDRQNDPFRDEDEK